MNNPIDMTPEQYRAEEIYLDSITYENDYKPMSYASLEKRLRYEGIITSTSALGRWADKFGWKEKSAQIVTAATIGNGEAKEIIEKASIGANVEKILTDFEANEKLKDDAYMVLAKQMKFYINQMEANGNLSLDNTKIVLKILEVTSTREDKLLDRQAMLSAAKMLKSDDVLLAIQKEEIIIEMDD